MTKTAGVEFPAPWPVLRSALKEGAGPKWLRRMAKDAAYLGAKAEGTARSGDEACILFSKLDSALLLGSAPRLGDELAVSYDKASCCFHSIPPDILRVVKGIVCPANQRLQITIVIKGRNSEAQCN